MAFNPDKFQVVTSRFENYPTLWSYNSSGEDLSAYLSTGYFTAASNTYNIGSGDMVMITDDFLDCCYAALLVTNGVITAVPMHTYYASVIIPDISTASSAYFGKLPPGLITNVYGTLWNAVTVATANITFTLGGTAMTGAAFAVTTAGVAGSLYTAAATGSNFFNGGTYISVVSDGGSTTTAPLTATLRLVTNSIV